MIFLIFFVCNNDMNSNQIIGASKIIITTKWYFCKIHYDFLDKISFFMWNFNVRNFYSLILNSLWCLRWKLFLMWNFNVQQFYILILNSLWFLRWNYFLMENFNVRQFYTLIFKSLWFLRWNFFLTWNFNVRQNLF